MSVFYANPAELRAKGAQMVEHAQAFADNVKKIYATIDEMVHSNYTSPDAIALANEIEKHHNDMNHMAQIIAEYGDFLSNFGSSVIKNQADNIANIKIQG